MDVGLEGKIGSADEKTDRANESSARKIYSGAFIMPDGPCQHMFNNNLTVETAVSAVTTIVNRTFISPIITNLWCDRRCGLITLRTENWLRLHGNRGLRLSRISRVGKHVSREAKAAARYMPSTSWMTNCLCLKSTEY
uniref:Uncharacterized protein n=1 Tax=Trichuris muris TaxID=70415 RepID=A0A5S6QB88_TRIMR